MFGMRWKRLFLSNNCSSEISKTYKPMLQWEEFEDINDVIRTRKSKDNDQRKKYERTSKTLHRKLKIEQHEPH